MSDLSVTSLFVKLITDPGCRRGKWQNGHFRWRFYLRSMLYPLTTFRYLRALCALEDAGQLLDVQPALPAKPHRPYLYRGSRVCARARAVLEHYHFVQGLPENVRRCLLVFRETPLARLEGKGGGVADILCTPCGFDREGELMLILRFNGTDVTRLSFSFIRWQGDYVLFVGGLQGPARGESGPEIIRQATRACYGLFPRRVLCEALTVIARVCGLDTVVAVSEENHVFRQLRYFYQKRGRFVARYSECWKSVGGVRQETGVYVLPVPLARKAVGDVCARKRAEYRRRNALLDSIAREIQVRTGSSVMAFGD